ncbi:MAG: WS/DGAT/MGAT family O-acyltransferase [Sciscionella sp.]
MSLLSPTDAVFLLAESREHPMHFGALQLFHLPDGAGPDFIGNLYRQLVAEHHVHPTFRRRPRGSLTAPAQLAWAQDTSIDLEYHVRVSALARPARVRELLELISRLHGTLLDRHRPLWEQHLIEGLQGDRFAIYSKVHHALLDGVSALRWMQRSMTEDPETTGMPTIFGLPPSERHRPDGGFSLAGVAKAAADFVGTTVRSVGELAGLAPTLAETARQVLGEQATALPFQAPKSMLNVPITGARRCAAQAWSMERIKAVRRATDSTVNDVVLAMCAGALRRYLLDMNALPEAGLVAMVPVSLRDKEPGGTERGGNAIGTILADLATESSDPASRLERIQSSVRRNKKNLSELSPLQVQLLAAITVAPRGFAMLPGMADRTRPPFNVIISNVPGPVGKTLYWNRARMDGLYPLSVVLDGQALNITVTTYSDQIQFGLVGCRRSMPHLQWLLTHLETSLSELETLVA